MVAEKGSLEAAALRGARQLLAPDLMIAECANALWKKTRRNEMTPETALAAARLIEVAPVELRPMRPFIGAATRLAHELAHPAYNCFYLALATAEGCPLVTEDERLIRVASGARVEGVAEVLTLVEAAGRLAGGAASHPPTQ